MYKYHCLNPIANIGLNQFGEEYVATENMKDADANVYIIFFIARNQMYMEVEYGLTCCLSIVLHNVITVASHDIGHLCHHLLGYNQRLCCHLVGKLIQIGEMLFRKYQRMPLGCRLNIENHAEVIILIDGR